MMWVPMTYMPMSSTQSRTTTTIISPPCNPVGNLATSVSIGTVDYSGEVYFRICTEQFMICLISRMDGSTQRDSHGRADNTTAHLPTHWHVSRDGAHHCGAEH